MSPINNPLRKLRKPVLIGFTIGIIVWLIAFIIVVYFIQTRKTEFLEDQLTDLLKADSVTIKQSSFVTFFPDLQIGLDDLTVFGKNSHLPDSAAVKLGRCDLVLNFPDAFCIILKKKKRILPIRGIYLDVVNIMLRQIQDSQRNFNLFSNEGPSPIDSTAGASKNGLFDFRMYRIDNFSLSNLKIDYLNESLDNPNLAKRHYRIDLDSLKFLGWFSQDSSKVKLSKMAGRSHQMEIGENMFFRDFPFSTTNHVTFMVKADQLGDNYRKYLITTSESELSLRASATTLSTDFQAVLFDSAKQLTPYTFNANVSGNIETESVGSDLDKMLGQENSIDTLDLQGDLSFYGEVKSQDVRDNDVSLNINFEGSNMSFRPNLPVLKQDRLEDLRLSGSVSNGAASVKEFQLEIDTIIGKLGKSSFLGKTTLSNFTKKGAKITSSLQNHNGKIDLNDLLGELRQEILPLYFLVDKVQGLLGFKVYLKGPMAYLNKDGLAKDSIRYSGEFHFDNFDYATDNVKLQGANGTIQLKENNLSIAESELVNGTINEQYFGFYGGIDGLATHFINESDSSKVEADFHLLLKNISLPEIISQLQDEKKDSINPSSPIVGLAEPSSTEPAPAKFFIDVPKFGKQLRLNVDVVGKGFTAADSTMFPESKGDSLYFDTFGAQFLLEDSLFQISELKFNNARSELLFDFKVTNQDSTSNKFEGNLHLATDSLNVFLKKIGQNLVLVPDYDIDFKTGMDWYFNGDVLNVNDDSKSDKAEFTVGLKNGHIQNIDPVYPLKNIDIDDLSLELNLESDSLRNTPVKIDTICALIDGSRISFDALIDKSSSDSSFIHINTLDTIRIPLESLYKYMFLLSNNRDSLENTISNVQGWFEFDTDLQLGVDSIPVIPKKHLPDSLKSKFKDVQHLLLIDPKLKSKVSNVPKFTIKKLPKNTYVGLEHAGANLTIDSSIYVFQNINGSNRLERDKIWVDGLSGEINESDFRVQSEVRALSATIFDKKPLQIDVFKLFSDTLDLTKLMDVNACDTAKAKKKGVKAKNEQAPSSFFGKFYDVTVDQIEVDVNHIYEKLSGYPLHHLNALKLRGDIKNNLLTIRDLNINVAEGQLNNQGLCTVNYQDTLAASFSVPLEIEGMRLDSLLEMVNDSCKKDIIDTLISLKLGGKLDANIMWDDTLYWNDTLFQEYSKLSLTEILIDSGSIGDGTKTKKWIKEEIKNGGWFLANIFYGIKSRIKNGAEFLVKSDSIVISKKHTLIAPSEFRSDIIFLAACGDIYPVPNRSTLVRIPLKKKRKKDESAILNPDMFVSYRSFRLRPKFAYKKCKNINKVKPLRFGSGDYCPNELVSPEN